MIKVSEVVDSLELLAPTCYAEDFDNVGLQIGNPNSIVKGILVTLDVTEDVVKEAIECGCNLIVSFHPLIFNAQKIILTTNRVGRLCQKIIKNDLSLYAIHTNLDNDWEGVNKKISDTIGLFNFRILIPKKEILYSLKVFVPSQNIEELRGAIFSAGAGELGNYKECSFSHEGMGTFYPKAEANPYIGENEKLYKDKEMVLNVLVPLHVKEKVLCAMKKTHPYETVAYEITKLSNENEYVGLGGIAEFDTPISEIEFLQLLSDKFNNNYLRHSKFLNKKIKKVSILGGSGSFAIKNAIQSGADAFVTSDLKYHDFFAAEENLFLVDLGHFESEQFTKKIIVKYLEQKFTKFATLKSKNSSNPVNYYICQQK